MRQHNTNEIIKILNYNHKNWNTFSWNKGRLKKYKNENFIIEIPLRQQRLNLKLKLYQQNTSNINSASWPNYFNVFKEKHITINLRKLNKGSEKNVLFIIRLQWCLFMFWDRNSYKAATYPRAWSCILHRPTPPVRQAGYTSRMWAKRQVHPSCHSRVPKRHKWIP